MLIRNLTIALAAALAMSGNALAQGVEAYVGGGVTYGDADCGSATCDEEVGYQIHAGADYIGEGWLLGVEVGYLATDFEASVNVLGLRVSGDYEVSTISYGVRAGGSLMEDRLTPYVRVGAHSYDAKVSSGGIGVSVDGTELYYGVGIEYDVWKGESNALGVRLDYTVYDADTAGDVKVLGLTGQYEFNLGY